MTADSEKLLQQFARSLRHRPRSIAFTITSGLVGTAILFTAFSIISILSLFDAQNALLDLSHQSFPKTTHTAQFSVLFHRLLDHSALLLKAETDEERSSAYHKIQQQIANLSELTKQEPIKEREIGLQKVRSLEQQLADLNDLVTEKIRIDVALKATTSNLPSLLQKTSVFKMADNGGLDKTNRQAFNEITRRLIASILQSHSIVLSALPQQIDEEKRYSETLLNDLTQESKKLKLSLQTQALANISQVREATLGEHGVYRLAEQLYRVNADCGTRIAAIRSSVEEKEGESVQSFFNSSLTSTELTHHLAEKIQFLNRILTGFFLITIIAALGCIGYFRQVLIARLQKLNHTVLNLMAGEKQAITISGNDEISAIAQSIKYLWQEMVKAKEDALKVADSKALFLAHMSHEIRTPMNAILGFSDLALSTGNPKEHYDYLTKINNASCSLLGIVNAILDYSKIEAGKFQLDTSEFDLRRTLEQLAPIIGLRCEESGLDFYFHIDPATPFTLKGDALRLGQILTNLITNAFKFTENGAISLQIRPITTPNNSPSHLTLLFSVEDSGSGISEEHAKNLFKPFTQADNSITRKRGGTGLGLAICKQLVAMMGGHIEMKRGEQGGSIFSFSVPFARPAKTTDTFYNGPEILKSLHAVVMSETPQTATDLSYQLKHFGISVVQASSLEEVIDILQPRNGSSRYELVFLDCPVVSQQFRQMLTKIRSLALPHDKPSLILTGIQRLGTQFQSLPTVDFDFFLEKPITPTRLLQALLKTLQLQDHTYLPAENGERDEKVPDSSHFAGGKILLVEDNEINQQVMLGFLHKKNLTVTTAENGALALEILGQPEAVDFGLILLDIQMPVMDGYTAAKAIRRLPPPVGTLPIIAVTAHAMQEELEKCRDAGMNGCITKPINANALYSIIAQHLRDVPGDSLQNKRAPEQLLPAEDLGKYAGIDIQAGLSRLLGDKNLYFELLDSFLKTYRNQLPLMREKLKDLAFDDLRRMVHNLKGVSGNLGMQRLYAGCAQMELSIKRKKISECESLLDGIGLEITTICEFLEQYLTGYQRSGLSQQRDETQDHHQNKEWQILLDELSHSLTVNNSKAIKQIRQFRTCLEQEDSFLFSRIEQHITNLDYHQAKLLLQEWQQSIHKN